MKTEDRRQKIGVYINLIEAIKKPGTKAGFFN